NLNDRLIGRQESGPVPEKKRPIEIDESPLASEQPIQAYAQNCVHNYLGCSCDVIGRIAEVGLTRTKEKFVSRYGQAAVEDRLTPDIDIHRVLDRQNDRKTPVARKQRRTVFSI